MTFYQRIQNAKKIAVVELGFLGDSIHLLPALDRIKSALPAAELHVLAAPLGGELLKMAPAADRVWSFPLTAKSPPWWKHWNLLRQMRAENFDAAITFSGADRALLTTWMIGGKRRLAHEGGRRHFWTPLLFAEVVSRRSRSVPVFQQRLDVLDAAGFPATESPRFGLAVPEEDRAWASREFGEAPFVHASLNASHPLKEWPLARWIELGRSWRESLPGVGLVATAGPGAREAERLRAFQAAAGAGPVRTQSDLSLGKLAAVIEKSSAHLGADSGVLHFSLVFAKPSVSFFRDYAGLEEWSPRGAVHRVFVQKCECADVKNPPCAGAGEARCLAGITPVSVIAAVGELLKAAPSRGDLSENLSI